MPWLVIGPLVVIAAVVLGVMIGPAGPTWWRIPLELLDRLPWISVDSGISDAQWNVVWQVRMPRVLLGGLVGAMLSIAGASYQGVFRNPLVDPYLLGAAAGAGLGATLVFTVLRSATEGWPIEPAPAMAFVVAVVTVFVTYVVGASFGGSRTGVTLVLAGVAVTSLATAVQTFILQRNVAVVREVYSWILGRLSTARWSDVRLVLPYVAVSAIVLLLHRRHLDLLRVGEDEASTLGAPVARVRLVVVIAATLGTAAVVSVSGLIGFVGIVVPHVVRLLAGIELSASVAADAGVRGRLPDPRRHPRTSADGSGRGADRCRHGVPRRPVLHHRAAGPRRRGACERASTGVRERWKSERTRRDVSSLELREVGVTYGRRQALAPFSDVVHSGEWSGLIGPNGAGKSSLLRAIVGLVDASGDVLVDGAPLAIRSRRRRSELVAYVPQSPILPDDMTGFEYVLLGRAPYVGYFGTESRHDKAMTASVLERLELEPFAFRRLGTLSGGERQRLVIARALAQEAPILLLDEPTSALDIGHQQQALELVSRLRRDHGLTVVSAMHDLTLAGLYSDRLSLLHEGLCVARGQAADVLQAETLAEFYGVRVTVHHEADGTVVVIPRRDVL